MCDNKPHILREFLPPYTLEFSVCQSSFFFHNAKLITNN